MLILIVLSGLAAWAQQQPIAFPHNRHIALGLGCLDCHSTADTEAAATIPSIYKCMLCHAKVATDGPGVTALREFAEQGREPPWERIYGFAASAHVKFRHAPHIRAGATCQSCHGEVQEMVTAQPAVRHNMGSCVSCHRQNQASDDCTVCHY